ncbi:uncharacterized protein LOC114273123 [Camellia sinensis]|uniref:uncharacterized protein LOC114273123 n=1 Tax=Camellia sinensis TaxID=4442 RepID=UPI001035929A|nr:uncharacterized protein LOC114273123 [Camellia sinensis]
MDSHWLHHLLSVYLSFTIAILESILLALSNIKRFPFFVTLANTILSLYYRFNCNLSPYTVDLDDQTTMHYWTASHRRFDKPNLILIHGYGSTSLWQFVRQVGTLSRSFNLYVPDLLFFGKSHTKQSDRTDVFQARCVSEGLKRLGVERYSVYAISYGGWVGYRMAEMYPKVVDKVVIVSSGLGFVGEEREKHLRKIEVNIMDLLCPQKSDDLRSLVSLTMHKYNLAKWIPDFFLREYISVTSKNFRKERLELAEYLLAKTTDNDLPTLTQETLLIWGDKDNVFPLFLAHRLQSHLGPKSKLEIIKDTGHAVNFDSPDVLNDLIKSFVLSSPKLEVETCIQAQKRCLTIDF